MVPAGNKNGALTLLAASLLTEGEVTLRNVPRIRDVDAMIALLEDLGAEVDWRADNEVGLSCAAVDDMRTAPDRGLSERIRASFLLAGPCWPASGTPRCRRRAAT